MGPWFRRLFHTRVDSADFALALAGFYRLVVPASREKEREREDAEAWVRANIARSIMSLVRRVESCGSAMKFMREIDSLGPTISRSRGCNWSARNSQRQERKDMKIILPIGMHCFFSRGQLSFSDLFLVTGLVCNFY